MQPKSIPEPARVENERTPTPFPQSGNNFVTVARLDDLNDPFAFMDALAFVHDWVPLHKGTKPTTGFCEQR